MLRMASQDFNAKSKTKALPEMGENKSTRTMIYTNVAEGRKSIISNNNNNIRLVTVENTDHKEGQDDAFD